MVICAAVIDKEKEEQLKRLGVRDSKLLSAAGRKRLVYGIKKLCKLYVEKITAKKINELMKHKSLNEIEANFMEKIIREISDIDDVETIYIDVPDPVSTKFVYRLDLPKKIIQKIKASHKAERYPTVAAASIIAKVIRDGEVEKIAHELGHQFGSGYPSDPLCVAFLERYIKDLKVGPKLKKYLRSEWKTTKELLQKLSFKTKQIKLEEF